MPISEALLKLDEPYAEWAKGEKVGQHTEALSLSAWENCVATK